VDDKEKGLDEEKLRIFSPSGLQGKNDTQKRASFNCRKEILDESHIVVRAKVWAPLGECCIRSSSMH